MDFAEAALTVLREEGAALHWTVIQDLALKRGYLDPFTQRDIRKNVLAALARAAREGRIEKQGTGTYVISSTERKDQ
jgi:HB1, ASXL, restriction endonuclease HTH domain